MSSKGYALWRAGEALIAHEDRDRRTLALLKRVEWKWHSDGWPACPCCGETQDVDEKPHTPDCELAALIRELQP